ncbi:hypothetical protein FOQG_10399 [Fusarium oxysporum f. sp. raphani 54005]|uniref:Uncharacterized protein n=3 Tax=Fusarium oxysporum TaxID=5507 RepID=X0BUM2_FUSOX|nr:hypothetical protein FOVG_14398 [Fusarium oxysporum f. sp. pisi HDV247]EXK85606.1 hypothetical protein FOQG_10399 [Fusarium oxysporum f. sp. raphani 54005]EXM19429.1 hypothetical protein FOTG_12482 [Fusarium oxysporum f. sp. vasinfectum 25433]KAK2668186.1 hypothetical protein RAB80_015566 [Fusarium oxysporum f. sp. vasinfectum]KAK2694382.1 hypothetical protein QWA68_005662 [Fusarium oxysporum]
MPEPVEAKTWSTGARSGSPRPTPPSNPSHPGRLSIKGGDEKSVQEEVLFGFGAQFESDKSKPASG